MPQNYYCLVAGLPNITLDDTKLSYGTTDFLSDMEEYVDKDNYKHFNLFKYKIDNENLFRAMIQHSHDFIEGGVYNQVEIEEALEEPINVVDYIKEFIIEYHDEEFDNEVDKKRLTQLYYDFILTNKNEFVREWFEMELNFKNIFSALNCRKYELPVEDELIDFNHVSGAIAKNSSRDFGLSAEYPYIEQLLTIFEIEDLLQREKAIDLIKWNWLDESTFFNYFTIEKLISYYIKLEMIERWIGLDPATGKELFEKFIKDLETGYEFPEEFKGKK
ncbi:MAG: DUF2764 family protein [Candidatus Delongbacteria bacterium]|jgi:hypothetical protein|nr:DUF2764 family protein [Candidatus Delongbacteria bacterium]